MKHSTLPELDYKPPAGTQRPARGDERSPLLSGLIALAAALLIGATLQPSALAGSDRWQIVAAPTDQEPFDAAGIVAAGGESLLVWSRETEDGVQVFAELHPAQGAAFGQRMPVYRIDDGDVVDTDVIRFQGEEQNALWGVIGQSAAIWLLGNLPEGKIGRDSDLQAWLSGREIAIEIDMADGSRQALQFTLAGSAEAIQAATGITLD